MTKQEQKNNKNIFMRWKLSIQKKIRADTQDFNNI